MARALLASPSLLILDEPIGAVDPLGAQEILKHITNAVAARGMAALIGLHRLKEMDSLQSSVIAPGWRPDTVPGSLDNFPRRWPCMTDPLNTRLGHMSLMSALAATAIRLPVCSLMVVAKRSAALLPVCGLLAALFPGTVFPIDLFPRWLRWTSYLVPNTYTMDIGRQVLDPPQGLFGVQHGLLGLVGFSVVTLAAGCWLLHRAFEYSRRMGRHSGH